MRKIILLAMLAVMVPFTAVAGPSANFQVEESKEAYSSERFTLGLQTGLANGTAHELVYFGNHKLSELIWDIKNVFMVEGNVSALLVPSWGLRLNASVSSMVNKQDSTMDDYDWFIIGADWTHWSHHGNTTLERALTFDVNLSKSLYSDKSGAFQLNGELGFKRDNWRWSASGGSFIYSVAGFRDTTGVFANIPVISYEQTINTPYIGASASYREENFSLFFAVSGSPFVYAEAVDHHYLRNLVFTDTFSSGRMVNVDLSYAYHMTKALSFGIAYAYQNYDMNRGDTVVVNQVTGATSSSFDSAGMDLTYHKVGFGAAYTF